MMFSWGKKDDHGVDIDQLKKYCDIVNGKDDAELINKGDYVQLKTAPFLDTNYAECTSEDDKAENFYAYVINKNDVSGISLGTSNDMKIAVVSNGKIHIKYCDSRLFQKSSGSLVKSLGFKVLETFARDIPIAIPVVGMLVRPRCNVELIFREKFTSMSRTSKFYSPLIILNTGCISAVILAGMTESNVIQTIEESTSILCEYIPD
jgi:hypothetical protein